MIEAFLSTYFDNPAGETVKPNLKIHHPVIRRIYEEYGICTSKDGFHRIIDPEKWQEYYMPWFLLIRDEGDGIFNGLELYPFITTGFGHAYIFANLEDEDLVGYIDISDNFNTMGSAKSFFLRNLNDPIFYNFNLKGEIYKDISPIEPPLTPDECFAQELHLHNGRKALPAERIWECLRHRFRGSASAF